MQGSAPTKEMDWYSISGISEDAQAELDLLSATFPELKFDAANSSALLSIPAREGSEGAARAVMADLALHLPAEYPAVACAVTVVRSRGGVDDRELQKQLQQVANESASDEFPQPCLYQLIEDARDVMGAAASKSSESIQNPPFSLSCALPASSLYRILRDLLGVHKCRRNVYFGGLSSRFP
jgi:hypothetical protein